MIYRMQKRKDVVNLVILMDQINGMPQVCQITIKITQSSDFSRESLLFLFADHRGQQAVKIRTLSGIYDGTFYKNRSSHQEVFLRKGFLKIYSKFTGEHPCRSVISIKLLCSFIEITIRYECSPVNLLHIFSTPFRENTSAAFAKTFKSFQQTNQIV